VAGHPAVRVDDDLAAGQAGVAHRASDDEASGRVDVHDRVARPELMGDHRQDDGLHEVVVQLGGGVGVVLGRHDDRRHPGRQAVPVLDGDLGLAVGPQPGKLARLAGLGQAAGHAVGQGDRERHQLRRLAAGEAEHHPLVAGPQLCRVDPPGDVRRLLLHADQGPAGLVVEAVVGLRVADLADVSRTTA